LQGSFRLFEFQRAAVSVEDLTFKSGLPFSKNQKRLTAWWMLIPAILGLLGVLYHEWWGDEAFTWLVAGASHSFSELIQNLGFQGHPRAYYLLAWMLRHVWKSPLAWSITNLAFSLGAIFLFLRSAPVTRFQAALFSLGFYPLYQYGIIARSYSFLIFLLFLYCYLRSTRPNAVTARLLVLAALAQVHLAALMAAGALLVFDWLMSRSVRQRKNWAATAIVVISLASSAWQMVPGNESIPRRGASEPSAVLIGFANAFVPNFGVLYEDTRARHYLQRELGLVLFLGSVGLILLWPRRQAVLAYAMLAGGLLTMCVFIYAGSRWHHGLYFIFMWASLWLAGGPPPVGIRRHFLSLILGIQAVVGLYAVGSDIFLPYSDGRLAAQFLTEQHLDQLPLVGLNVLPDSHGTRYQWEVFGIQSIFLDLEGRNVYDPVAKSYETFFRHMASIEFYPTMGRAEFDRQFRELAAHFNGPFVVVVLRHLPPDVPMELPPQLQKLKDLPQVLDYGEALSIYQYSQ
jgi:hypothetical protein